MVAEVLRVFVMKLPVNVYSRVHYDVKSIKVILHETVFSSTLVQLKQNFDTTRLEKFPSKSLLSLNEWQLEERRLMLERYLHTGEGEGREGEEEGEGGGKGEGGGRRWV